MIRISSSLISMCLTSARITSRRVVQSASRKPLATPSANSCNLPITNRSSARCAAALAVLVAVVAAAAAVIGVLRRTAGDARTRPADADVGIAAVLANHQPLQQTAGAGTLRPGSAPVLGQLLRHLGEHVSADQGR